MAMAVSTRAPALEGIAVRRGTQTSQEAAVTHCDRRQAKAKCRVLCDSRASDSNLEKSGEAPWRKQPQSSGKGQMKVSLTKGERRGWEVYQGEGMACKRTHRAGHTVDQQNL